MNSTVHYLTPLSKLDDFDRDMVELEIASLSTHQKLEAYRDRVGKILGTCYLLTLIEHLNSGKPILPKGFNPTEHKFPYQYAHHLGLMNEQELELLLNTIAENMKKSHDSSNRSRKELFYIRSEVMRRIENLSWKNLEKNEISPPPVRWKPKLSIVKNG